MPTFLSRILAGTALLALFWGMVGVPAEAQTTERTISQREAPLAGAALSADISANGRKDLVIASVDYERVVWHLNEIGTSGADDDGYGRAQEILSGADDIQEIGLADINGSGGADLVLFLEDGVAWRKNQTGDSSTEAFGERKVITDRTADPFRNGFQLSDLSGDGRADLALLDENSGTLYWFKNEVNTSEADADGFGEANEIGSLNTSDQEVFVSDLNADGSEDILVDGTWFENQIGTSSADSDGFAPGEDLFRRFSSTRISLVGDLDGDGDADLVDTDGRWRRNEYVESGKVNFISEGAITSESFQTLSLEDADGDGDPDIFLKDYSDRLIWRENQIGESGADDDGFGPAKAIGTQTDATILAETINGDDRADLVASSREAGVEWYPSEVGDSGADSDGFGPANPIQTPGPLHDVQDAQVADLDGDGDLDIVSASAGNDQIAWHPNQIGESGADSDGFGSLKRLTTSADSVVSLATGDVDSDGDPDVFAAYGSPSKVVWIENQIGESGVDGDGFGPVQEITTDIKSAHDITVGDLDSDGDPDVISGAAESETIAWHENQVGEGSSDGGGFSSKKVISTGDVDEAFGSSNQTPNIRVVSADFDEDGKPDVAGFVASGSRMEVAWHENQIGTSTADSDGFGPAEVSETGSYSFTYQDLVAKDIDLDGSVDLATTRGWYENRTQDAFPSTEFYGISYDRSLPGQISKALAATDWDADGDPDIALLGYRGKLISLENQAVDPDPFGETSARRAQDIAEGFADATSLSGADLDGDFDPDMLATSAARDKLVWYENQTSGSPSQESTASAYISGDGRSSLPETGLHLSHQGVGGSGQFSARRFSDGPTSSEGIEESTVSSFRITFETTGSLTIGGGSKLRFDLDQFPGITAPEDIQAYARPGIGQGKFSSLNTSYDEDTGKLIAESSSFGEVVLASDSNPLDLPSRPTSLTAKSGPGDVSLSWTVSSPTSIEKYRIYRSVTPIDSVAGPSGRVALDSLQASTSSYADEPEPGQTYYYRVTAVGPGGDESGFSEEVRTFLSPQEVTAQVSRSFGNASGPQDYRLVALPGRADTSLTDVLGGEAGVQWQAYLDDGSDQDFLVKYDGSEAFRFEAGRGFWVTSTGKLTFGASVPSVKLRSSSAARIGLQAGWNVISNPLGKDVAWSEVRAATGADLQPLWAFGGSFDTTATFASATEGRAYYFFNKAGGPDSLVVPYPGAPEAGKQASRRIASNQADPQATEPGEPQALALTASAGGQASEIAVTLVEPEGTEEALIAPPGRFEPVSLRIQAQGNSSEDTSGRSGLLMADGRVAEGGGATFPLQLTSRAEGRVKLSAEGLQEASTQEARLLRPSAGRTYDLGEKGTIRVSLEKGKTIDLKLAVGTEGYVEDRAEDVLPDEVTLKSYPNPVRRQGTLEYALPEASEVSLKVYDILGREVATVEQGRKQAGRHQVTFEAGRLSSGAYFGRLEAGGQTRTQKITVVR